MVEIKNATCDDGRNVRVVQRGELCHCPERRGRSEGGELSGVRPFFLILLSIPEVGYSIAQPNQL